MADLTVAEGRRAAMELVARSRLPSAAVAASDEVAIGLQHELRRLGVDVPGRMSIIGVDDHPHAVLHDLTTMSQPVAEQAELAARWLLQQLADGPRAGAATATAEPRVEARRPRVDGALRLPARDWSVTPDCHPRCAIVTPA